MHVYSMHTICCMYAGSMFSDVPGDDLGLSVGFMR